MATPQEALKIAMAIKQVESGGNYNAKGASGESGAYQFMPATWSNLAQKHLGDPKAQMTPAAQNEVATREIHSLLEKGHTPKEVALIWNGGQPIEKKGVNSKGVAYDSGAYANKVTSTLEKISKPKIPEFNKAIDKGRTQGKTDTELLDLLGTKSPQIQGVIGKLREKAQTTNRSDREVLNYLSKKLSGSEPTVASVPLQSPEQQIPEQPQEQPEKKLFTPTPIDQTALGHVQNFVKEDIGQGVSDENLSKNPVAKFGEEVFQNVLGSKGSAGLGHEEGKLLADVATGGQAEKNISQMHESLGGLADMTTKAIKMLRTLSDGPKKDRLQQVINTNLSVLKEGHQHIADYSKAEVPDIKKLAGTGINTAVNALTGGEGGLIETGVKEGVIALDLPYTAAIKTIGKVATSLPARMAEMGGVGATFQASSNLEENRPIGEHVASTGIFSSMIPLGATAMSAVSEKLALPVAKWLTEKLPAKLINQDIKPLEKHFRFGVNPGEGVVQEGIVANTRQELAQKIQDKKKEVWALGQKLFSKPENKAKIRDVSPVLQIVDSAIQDAAKGGKENQSLVTRLQNFRESLTHSFELKDGQIIATEPKNITKLSPDEIQQLKRDIGENTTWTGQAFDNELNQVKSKVYNALDGIIDEAVPGMDKINSRYANLLNAQKATERQIIMKERQHLITLVNRFGIAAEVGYGIISGDWKGAGIALIGSLGAEALQSTASRTRIAQFLNALAPTERESILRSTPILRDIWKRMTGKSAMEGETPQMGLSIKEVGDADPKIKALRDKLHEFIGKTTDQKEAGELMDLYGKMSNKPDAETVRVTEDVVKRFTKGDAGELKIQPPKFTRKKV